MLDSPSETLRTPEEMRQQLDKWLRSEDGFRVSGPNSVEQSIHASAYVTVTRHGNTSTREDILTWGSTRVKLLSDGSESGSYGNEAKPFTALFNDIVDVLEETQPRREARGVSGEHDLVIGKIAALTRPD